MEDLMDDLHGNAKLRPIIDDGEGDIPLWNKEIAKVSYFLFRKNSMFECKLTSVPSRLVLPRQGFHECSLALRWCVSSWSSLHERYSDGSTSKTEAYKYRRLHECFSLSKYWKNYDVFFRQSESSVSRGSRPKEKTELMSIRPCCRVRHFLSLVRRRLRALPPIRRTFQA